MPPFLVLIFIGLLCLGLGLVMLVWQPGPNGWIGVRLPWTYADREIWDKSWRLAAFLLVLMGLSAFSYFPAFVAATVLMLVGCIVYPWRLYHRKYGTSRYWKDHGWTAYRPAVRCNHCGHLQNLPSDHDLPGALCEACSLPVRR